MSKDLIVRLREAAAQRVASTAMIGADDLIAAADALESQAATPSSHWRAEGAPDPHAGHYDGERAALTMGKLTDDELANGAFMNYDQPLNLAGILAGTHASPIAWMTAVKDRIRWLSRSMEKSEARLHEVAVACATAEQERDALTAELKALREQEPSCWTTYPLSGRYSKCKAEVDLWERNNWTIVPLYTHPVPTRELTDETIQRHWDEACKDTPQTPGWSRHIRFARAIERHLKGDGE